MLLTYGHLVYKDNALKVQLSHDFGLYYKHFIDKQFRIFSHTPAHGTHVTIFTPKLLASFGTKIDMRCVQYILKKFHRQRIALYYDPYIHIGGSAERGFRNFYMDVESTDIDLIYKYLKIDQYKQLHITISNTKNGVKPYIFYTK